MEPTDEASVSNRFDAFLGELDGLTPNMTRRAQVASWLLYYRTELHGVPIDELRRRRAARAAAEAAAPEKQAPTGMAGQSVV